MRKGHWISKIIFIQLSNFYLILFFRSVAGFSQPLIPWVLPSSSTILRMQSKTSQMVPKSLLEVRLIKTQPFYSWATTLAWKTFRWVPHILTMYQNKLWFSSLLTNIGKCDSPKKYNPRSVQNQRKRPDHSEQQSWHGWIWAGQSIFWRTTNFDDGFGFYMALMCAAFQKT